jgi:hypothetical protein
MNIISKLVASALLLSAIAPVMGQDKVSTVPVSFVKGSSSATMKGNFGGYDSVNYTLSARAGQTMTVKITGSSSANFNVFKPGDAPGNATAVGSGSVGTDWSGALPATGKYTVQVFQMRASGRRGEQVPYTVTFRIQ